MSKTYIFTCLEIEQSTVLGLDSNLDMDSDQVGLDLDSRQKGMDLDLDSRQQGRFGFGFGFEVPGFEHH